MAHYNAVAAFIGGVNLGVVARKVIVLSVPMENATADGVERQMFLVANGEVHDDDAVAASMR